MSKPSTAERRDDLHRAIQVKGIRIAIFMLGYWGALLFGVNQAAELWPQYFARAPFWAAVVAFLGFAWNCYRDLGDWRRLTSLETRATRVGLMTKLNVFLFRHAHRQQARYPAPSTALLSLPRCVAWL